MNERVGKLDSRFSSPGATATAWAAASELVEAAMTYSLATVRPDGRPHVVTIAGVWLDEIFYFTTGLGEQKANNLGGGNHHVVVATGCNGWEGLDMVLEGEALAVSDETLLTRLALALTAKYDDFFRLRVVDGQLRWAESSEQTIEGRRDAVTEDGPLAFEVRPTKAFALGKGAEFSQTRWRFASAPAEKPGSRV
jgi:hypothetical protein